MLMKEMILTAYSESVPLSAFFGLNSEQTICAVKVSAQTIAHIKAGAISACLSKLMSENPSRSKVKDMMTLWIAKRNIIV